VGTDLRRMGYFFEFMLKSWGGGGVINLCQALACMTMIPAHDIFKLEVIITHNIDK
jgi:hypothetical protein